MNTTIIQAWLHQYGLVVVFIGTFLEGESVLIGASVLAARGVLPPVAVWATATAGAWCGHCVGFAIGRAVGPRLTMRYSQFAARVQQTGDLVARRPKAAIFVLQYLYGARIAGAVAFGLTDFSSHTFFLYQAVNCAVWAAGVTFVGYAVGEELHEVFTGSVRWVWIAASVVVIGLIVRTVLRLPARRTMGTTRNKRPTQQ